MYPDDSLTLHTDLYQINMMQVYFEQGIHNKKAVFEAYFRQQPFKNGYAVFAGLERIVNYLKNLRFSESDIAYLESLGYKGAFLDYLKNFKMELTVRSAKEGDLVFANEPIVQVEGPLAQCQLVETALLNIVNFQTLIATKAARIKAVIEDEPLMERKKWMRLFGEPVQLLLEALAGPVTYVQENSLTSLSLGPMPMPWCRSMVMIIKPSRPMLRPIATVSS